MQTNFWTWELVTHASSSLRREITPKPLFTRILLFLLKSSRANIYLFAFMVSLSVDETIELLHATRAKCAFLWNLKCTSFNNMIDSLRNARRLTFPLNQWDARERRRKVLLYKKCKQPTVDYFQSSVKGNVKQLLALRNREGLKQCDAIHLSGRRPWKTGADGEWRRAKEKWGLSQFRFYSMSNQPANKSDINFLVHV